MAVVCLSPNRKSDWLAAMPSVPSTARSRRSRRSVTQGPPRIALTASSTAGSAQHPHRHQQPRRELRQHVAPGDGETREEDLDNDERERNRRRHQRRFRQCWLSRPPLEALAPGPAARLSTAPAAMASPPPTRVVALVASAERPHRLGDGGAQRRRLPHAHDGEAYRAVEWRKVALLEPSRLALAQVQSHNAGAVLDLIVQRRGVAVQAHRRRQCREPGTRLPPAPAPRHPASRAAAGIRPSSSPAPAARGAARESPRARCR